MLRISQKGFANSTLFIRYPSQPLFIPAELISERCLGSQETAGPKFFARSLLGPHRSRVPPQTFLPAFDCRRLAAGTRAMPKIYRK